MAADMVGVVAKKKVLGSSVGLRGVSLAKERNVVVTASSRNREEVCRRRTTPNCC